MSLDDWDLSWFDGGSANQSMLAWRGVEAQHIVSTMRLVDTLDEQAVLEQLLETSKPPMPTCNGPKHYLLSTPFRYHPTHPSRFRAASTAGLWYGAQELFAACAEVAYWRHRFLIDSLAFSKSELLTEHTFYQASVNGMAIDLMAMPWVQSKQVWTHPSDYGATVDLANTAKTRNVQWIRYESVRAPGHCCAAVLDVNSLSMVDAGTTQQTWHCKTTTDAVMMQRAQDRYVWRFERT